MALGLLLASCAGPVLAQIAPGCAQYRWTLTRNVQKTIGINAPVALFAGQMMQESGCRADARSPVGAGGLTQFMPATANWIPSLDSSLSPVDVYDPSWALKAQVVYMAWLIKRNQGLSECDSYAFALSSYNGGEGWLRRDQKQAAVDGKDPKRWFGHVEATPDRRRSPAAIKENRGYPKRIMLTLAPRFVSAGWGRAVDCGAN